MGCLFSDPQPKTIDKKLITVNNDNTSKAQAPPPQEKVQTNKQTENVQQPAPKEQVKPQEQVKPEQPKPAEPEPPKPENEPKPAEIQPLKPIINDNFEAFGLLLCGSGESGKTTFTRQLRIKYLNGFQAEEKAGFVSTIRGNLIETMQILLVWLDRNSKSVDDDNKENATLISLLDPFSCEYNEEIQEALTELWADEEIQEAFTHKDETQIPDHMQYFFEKLEEVSDPEYVPTDEDVLRARIRTIGITNVTFDIDGALIRIYDVGGQKNERSKWEKVMNEVGGVIYCVSFSEFDKPMFEDKSVLRINDSIQVFEQITHRKQFATAPFFLLCNKFDIFKEKITNTDCFLKVYPEFTGNAHDPDECAQYIIDKFLAAAGEMPKRPINVRKIVALNPDDVVDATSFICKFVYDNYYE